MQAEERYGPAGYTYLGNGNYGEHAGARPVGGRECSFFLEAGCSAVLISCGPSSTELRGDGLGFVDERSWKFDCNRYLGLGIRYIHDVVRRVSSRAHVVGHGSSALMVSWGEFVADVDRASM